MIAALLVCLLVSSVGRILLAWLPAGAPGAHGPREIIVTWAASFALGAGALVHQLRLQDSFAIWSDRPRASGAFLLLPWVVLGACRVATLPAGLVPRHAPRAEHPSLAASALLAAALVAAAAIAWTRGASTSDALLGAAAACATLLLVERALAVARRAPLARRALLVCVAASALAWAGEGERDLAGVLLWTLGAASAVGWLRRADARERWLATLAFTSIVALDPAGWPAPAAALAALIATTAAPSRLRTATTALVCGALALLAAGAGARRPALALEGSWPAALVLVGALVLVLAVVRARARATHAATATATATATGEAIAPPLRESVFAGLALLGGGAALLLAREHAPELHALDAPLGVASWRMLVPAAWLALGLALLPAERPSAADRRAR